MDWDSKSNTPAMFLRFLLAAITITFLWASPGYCAPENSKLDNAFLRAAETGNISAVKERIDEGANINARTQNHNSALRIAVCQFEPNYSLASLLLKRNITIPEEEQTEIGGCLLNVRSEPPSFRFLNRLIKRGFLPQNLMAAAVGSGKKKYVTFLVEKHNVDVDIADFDDVPMLALAARWGHFDVVRYLFDKGADINAKDEHQRNAVHNCLRTDIWPSCGHTHMKWLIDAGVNLKAVDRGKRSVMHYGARLNDIDVLKTLLKHGAPINLKNNAKENVLHYNAEFIKWPTISFFLDHGLDVNARNRYGQTLLFLLARFDRQVELFEPLLARKASINIRDRNKRSILFYILESSTQNTLEKVQLFLSKGARFDDRFVPYFASDDTWSVLQYLVQKRKISVHAKNPDKQPLVIWAAQDQQWDIVKDLIKRGARLKGKSAYDRERRNTIFFAVKAGNCDMVRVLKQKGANINHRFGKYRRTVLLHLAEHNDFVRDEITGDVEPGKPFEMVRCLANNGAWVNATERRYKDSVLHNAAIGSEIDIIRFLLQRKAKVNKRNRFGRTPLATALLSKRDIEVIKLLVQHGASRRSKDRRGRSIMYYAKNLGDRKIITFLKGKK